MQPRPISITVFGILNIGFSLFEVFGVFASRFMEHAKISGRTIALAAGEAHTAWTHFVEVFGIVQAIMLMAAGIGLLLTRHWARVLSVAYSIIAMVYVAISAVMNYSSAQATVAQVPSVPPHLVPILTLAVTIFGVIFGLIYPTLLLFFMTRPKVMAAFTPPSPAIPPPLP